jgi:hypothetical protein
MRETVLGDTPASFATISRVTAEPFLVAVTRRSNSDRRILRFLAFDSAYAAGVSRESLPRRNTMRTQMSTEWNTD